MASITWTGACRRTSFGGQITVDAPGYDTQLPTNWIDNGATAYLGASSAGNAWAALQLSNVSGNEASLRTASTANNEGTGNGPQLVPDLEINMTIRFVSGANDITVNGPNAAGSTTSDTFEPYAWTPANSAAIATFVTNVSNGDTMTVTINDGLAPAAAAPTVTVGAIASVTEGTMQTLTASISGGTYDTIAYAWEIVTGIGTITGSGASVTYNAPQVNADSSVTVRCTVTASGTGTNSQDGTSDTASDDEAFTVMDAGAPASISWSGNLRRQVHSPMLEEYWMPVFTPELPIEWIDGNAVAYISQAPLAAGTDLAYLTLTNAGAMQLRLTETSGPFDLNEGAGPNLTTAIERDMSIHFEATGRDILVRGPTAPGTGLTDTTEPYSWTPANVAEIGGFVTGLLNNSSITVTIYSNDGNNFATGQPGITGVAEQNETLTLTLGTLADADGLPSNDFSSGFSFQWLRNNLIIAGATGSSYVIQPADINQTLKCRVIFTDNDGHVETATSTEIVPMPAVVVLPDAVAPSVAISSLATLNEGSEHTFTITLDGGTYDTVAVTASVTGSGTLGSVSGSGESWMVTYTAPSVTADEATTLTVTAAVTGTGTNAADNTTASASATEMFTVANVETNVRMLPVVADLTFQVGVMASHTFPEMLNPDGTVTYALPESLGGLTFDAATRTLSGTPTLAVDARSHTYSATDNTGTLSRTFTITITEAVTAASDNPSHFTVEDRGGRVFRIGWRAPMGSQRYSVGLRIRDLVTGLLRNETWLPPAVFYADNHSATFIDTLPAPNEMIVLQVLVQAYGATEQDASNLVWGSVVIPPSTWEPQHRLLCDWDRNDNPTDEFPNVLRATADVGRQNDLLNSPINPSLSVTWSNESERYTDDYASSPLAGKLVPGFDVTFEIVNNGQTIPIFKGTASEIGADGESRIARMAADGPLTVLADVMLGTHDNVSANEVGRDLFEAMEIPIADVVNYGNANTVEHFAGMGSAQQVLRSIIPAFMLVDGHEQLHGGISVTPSGKIRMDSGHWADGQDIDLIRQAARPALGSNIRSMSNRIGARLTSIEPDSTVTYGDIGWDAPPGGRIPPIYSPNDARGVNMYYVQRVTAADERGYVVAGTAVDHPAYGSVIQFNADMDTLHAETITLQGSYPRGTTRLYYRASPLQPTAENVYDVTVSSIRYYGLLSTMWHGSNAGLGVVIVEVEDAYSGTLTLNFLTSRLRMGIHKFVTAYTDSVVRDQESDDQYGTRRHTLGTIPLIDGDTGDVLTGRILAHRKAPRRHVTQRYQVVDEETAQLLAFQSGDVVTHNDRRYRILRKVYSVSAGRAPEMDITIIEAAPSGVT